ncbi:MAG: nucleotide sugar dehydrogenase [Thermomicrobiales bacterium]
MDANRVAVIGGAGHVGLGMCLVLADAGWAVDGIDVNDAANAKIMAGVVPSLERHGEEYLAAALRHGRLKMTSDASVVSQAGVVIIILGTPIDENLNPRFGHLKSLLVSLKPFLRRGQLIVLRSTVSPGTTERVRTLIERLLGWECGRDYALVFAPERVLQGHSIEELTSLPQIVGAFDDHGYEQAARFFSTYVRNECIRLTPVEAELGKLITNMSRYLSFAFANEIHLIADIWSANANRIIDAINRDYPRLRIPRPGPNVGGPCLYKDGYFLLERIPFPELISAAFKINEGMTAQIAMKIERMPHVQHIGILGMSFKADNDDLRNSLSFKLRKQLDNGVYEVSCVDPFHEEYQDVSNLQGADCIVLMTPHSAFADLGRIAEWVGNPECRVIDIWGFWTDMRYESNNGVFRLGDAMAAVTPSNMQRVGVA